MKMRMPTIRPRRSFGFRARVRFERAYPYVLGYSGRTSVSVG